ncbi:MAG: hypothetical protein M3Q08_00095 [Pseudomonadota bacterium]|nr:hypothetical protein [Pseudomonadota bacterium]
MTSERVSPPLEQADQGRSEARAGNLADAVHARKFTSKQMGDACEMLVAAELTLAGIPALKVPDNWPHYDVIAQPISLPAQRISVKSRTFKRGAAFVEYNDFDEFDWLAIVLLNGTDGGSRSIYVIPRISADHQARQDKPTSKTAKLRYFRIDEVDRLFSGYRDNFTLSHKPAPMDLPRPA